MVEKYTVDRVIGTKVCRRCGYPVSVESYSIQEAKERLERIIFCSRFLGYDDEKGGFPFTIECEHDLFTDPKFEVKMKMGKPWVSETLKRMGG
jgi:hypothetical protein